MQHLKEFQEAFDYVTQLPVNANATVDVSHSEYGVQTEIHRASKHLVEQIILDQGPVQSVYIIPTTGNAALRLRGMEVFVSPATFADLQATGALTHG